MNSLIRFLLLLMSWQCALAQSSLPLTAGKVFVGSIDIDSRKKIRLPEGRWVVMGLHTNEIPLTGGSKTSQAVNNVSLMNDDENAPFQYLSVRWTESAGVNWTDQPCDSSESVKFRPKKETFNTNTSSLTIKCSAASYNTKFGDLNFPQNYISKSLIIKNLWLPVAQHSRSKPIVAVEVYGFVSKHKNDFINWYGYINPYAFGLDQLSDTQYSTPTSSRQIVADKLLDYAMNWNKQYMNAIEKDFFPVLFQSASLSFERFNFSERVPPMTLTVIGQNPSLSVPNNQSTTASSQTNRPLNINSRLPPCQGTDESRWTNCFGTATYTKDKKYGGEFKDGDESQYVGEWKDGNFNGQGIEYRANGYMGRSGIWSSGKYIQWVALDRNSFPYNPSNLIATSNPPSSVEIDRITADVEAERKKRQDLEQQLASSRDRERITAELDLERKKRQELEAQLAASVQPASSQANAPRRIAHALVIGNGAYPGSGRLDNPVNDANAISQKLRSMGFNVTTVTDANRQRLVQSMAQFRRTAASADISLLYYAGHGVQIFGTNYILPTDVDQTDPAQATIQGVSLNSVVENFLPGKTTLVFLDACRDNALQRTSDRSVSKGLAPISVAEGTLISYATKDGQTAADGVGKNSPFTQALLEHINDPQDIAVVLRKVRERVMKITGGKQQPWEYGSLTGGELVLSAIKPK